MVCKNPLDAKPNVSGCKGQEPTEAPGEVVVNENLSGLFAPRAVVPGG